MPTRNEAKHFIALIFGYKWFISKTKVSNSLTELHKIIWSRPNSLGPSTVWFRSAAVQMFFMIIRLYSFYCWKWYKPLLINKSSKSTQLALPFYLSITIYTFFIDQRYFQQANDLTSDLTSREPVNRVHVCVKTHLLTYQASGCDLN